MDQRSPKSAHEKKDKEIAVDAGKPNDVDQGSLPETEELVVSQRMLTTEHQKRVPEEINESLESNLVGGAQDSQ